MLSKAAKYSINVTPPPGAVSATETNGRVVNKNESNKSAPKQAAINDKNWKATPLQSNGMVCVIDEPGIRVAPNPQFLVDKSSPTPAMNKRIAIHQLKVSSLTIMGVGFSLDDQKPLKKQLFGNYSLAKLRELNIDVGGIMDSTNLYRQLGKVLAEECPQLEKLYLDMSLRDDARFVVVKQHASSKLAFDGFKHLSNLKDLTLVFRRTDGIFDGENVFAHLGKTLAKLGGFNKLEKIEILMSSNSVSDKEMLDLFRGMSGIKSLKNVSIDMQESRMLTQEGFDGLGDPLRKLKNLESLRLMTDPAFKANKVEAALPSIKRVNISPVVPPPKSSDPFLVRVGRWWSSAKKALGFGG